VTFTSHREDIAAVLNHSNCSDHNQYRTIRNPHSHSPGSISKFYVERLAPPTPELGGKVHYQPLHGIPPKTSCKNEPPFPPARVRRHRMTDWLRSALGFQKQRLLIRLRRDEAMRFEGFCDVSNRLEVSEAKTPWKKSYFVLYLARRPSLTFTHLNSKPINPVVTSPPQTHPHPRPLPSVELIVKTPAYQTDRATRWSKIHSSPFLAPSERSRVPQCTDYLHRFRWFYTPLACEPEPGVALGSLYHAFCTGDG